MTQSIKTLIERLEKASGPDASLDHDIGMLVGFGGNFSSSIDSALTLVPEGWGWSIGDVHGPQENISEAGLPWAEIWIRGHKNIHLPGMNWDGIGRNHINAATPAIALCIAALKSREAQT